MPKVLNKYTDEIPPDAVWIMRPSKWGNPFQIGRDGTREEVLEKYLEWVWEQPELIEAIIRELRGKDLVCCCAPRKCHGDVLLKMANSLDDTTRREIFQQAGLNNG